MEINEVVDTCHGNAVKSGWWTNLEIGDKVDWIGQF
jgi:hypothetical protein